MSEETKPHIHTGIDDKTGHWNVCINGVPIGKDYLFRDQAWPVLVWLKEGGYEALFKARKEGK